MCCRTINGTKKWISGGMHSDYFTVGAKVSDRSELRLYTASCIL